MSKPIELAVLDMAGTTIRDDDAVNQCLRDSLQDSGIQVTRDEVNEVMGLPKPAAIQALIESKAARAPAEGQVDALHKGFVERMVMHYRTSSAVEPMPFAVQVLTELRRNQIKVFLNTGFSRPIVTAILERLGWTDSSLVDGVVASDEVRHGRPHADMIIRAMALGEVTLRDWFHVMRKEIISGLMLGCILGGIGFMRVAIWSQFSDIYGPHWFLVALTVGFALVGVVLWGSLSGSMLPFILRFFGADPATSSAPFVATLVDVTGLIIYFSLALVIMRGALL